MLAPASIVYDQMRVQLIASARPAASAESNTTATVMSDTKARLQDLLPDVYPRIYRSVAGLTYGSGLNAEDLTQEVFLKAFRNAGSFQDESAIYTWLYRIARNTCHDAMRHLKIKRRLGLDRAVEPMEDQWESPDDGDPLVAREAHHLLRLALGRLPGKQRELIVFKDLQEMTYADIGNIIGIPEGTVKSRLFKARLMLKEELEKLGYTP